MSQQYQQIIYMFAGTSEYANNMLILCKATMTQLSGFNTTYSNTWCTDNLTGSLDARCYIKGVALNACRLTYPYTPSSPTATGYVRNYLGPLNSTLWANGFFTGQLTSHAYLKHVILLNMDLTLYYVLLPIYVVLLLVFVYVIYAKFDVEKDPRLILKEDKTTV